jgi:hypothetical protein
MYILLEHSQDGESVYVERLDMLCSPLRYTSTSYNEGQLTRHIGQ